MALRLFACAAFILSSLALAVANSPARPPGDLPVATDARLEVQGEIVRLTMALSRR
jgi:N-acetylmuramoyl-L-alanine amidase